MQRARHRHPQIWGMREWGSERAARGRRGGCSRRGRRRSWLRCGGVNGPAWHVLCTRVAGGVSALTWVEEGGPRPAPAARAIPAGARSRGAWKGVALLGGLLLLGLATRGPLVGAYLANWDAVQYALGMAEFDVTRHQPHPPGSLLYVALGRALLGLTGDPQRALGTISVLGGSVSLVLCAVVGRMLFGWRIAVAGTLLYATSPLTWYYGGVALPYALEGALVLGVVALLWPAAEERRPAYAAGGCGGAGGGGRGAPDDDAAAPAPVALRHLAGLRPPGPPGAARGAGASDRHLAQCAAGLAVAPGRAGAAGGAVPGVGRTAAGPLRGPGCVPHRLPAPLLTGQRADVCLHRGATRRRLERAVLDRREHPGAQPGAGPVPGVPPPRPALALATLGGPGGVPGPLGRPRAAWCSSPCTWGRRATCSSSGPWSATRRGPRRSSRAKRSDAGGQRWGAGRPPSCWAPWRHRGSPSSSFRRCWAGAPPG